MNDISPSSPDIPFVRPDGCIEHGAIVVRPWPSLRITPLRTLTLTHEILWAKPRDRLWPFTARIPRPLLTLARTVPAREWDVLELLSAAPERGCELLRRCPALAMLMILACPAECQDRTSYYCSLLDLTWRDALEAIGFGRRKSWVRLLRKIPLDHCTEKTVSVIAGALRDRHPRLRSLSHLPRLTSDTAALLALPVALVNSHLLLASSGSEHDETPNAWRVESVSWFREFEEPGRPWPYVHLTAQALERIEQDYRRWYAEDGEGRSPFPAPPLPSIPGKIVALRNYWSLVAEGQEQCNCASTYAEDIRVGQCYVYAVTIHERASLVLRRLVSSRLWIIDDLKAANNTPASEATELFVHAWLREHQA